MVYLRPVNTTFMRGWGHIFHVMAVVHTNPALVIKILEFIFDSQ